MKRFAGFSLAVLTIFLAAVYLPMLYEKIFFDEIEKTHLFYSPVSRDFIFKEKVVGDIPDAVREKSEDHHAQISYQDSSGNYMARVEFEKRLPFIFYKNMEIWGLLPLELSGRSFDKQAIKQNRRVLELKSGMITGNSPETRAWPLLESNPGQARLVFPDDRFTMTDRAMTFINADTNRADPGLTETFTTALTQAGFAFPARSVSGKFTVLKPFDEGIFLVDQAWQVFHVKRVDGLPRVEKTPIDKRIKTRYIKISENRTREFYGLLLDHSGRVWLLTYDNYRLIPIPLKGYDPDRMDLKLIFNPLYCTAVYSDASLIHAVAMDREFNPLAEFSHAMSRQKQTLGHRAFNILFPFSIHLDDPASGFLRLRFDWSGITGLAGALTCLLIFGIRSRASKEKIGLLPAVLVALTGIYGLLAVKFAELKE